MVASDRFLLDQRSLGWLLLIALVVLGAGLGLRDPWPADEPRFALVAKEMVESGQWLFPMRGGEIYPDKPPLFMWGIALGYLLTGSIKVAFLLPSLLAGLLTITLVWDMGRRLWNPSVGFLAGLLLLFTLQFTLQAKTAQIDALVTFFITLGVYGFVRFLLCGGGWRWYWLGWFAAGLGIITKGVGLLALLILIPAIWTHREKIRAASRSDWLKGLAGPLFMLLAIGLWLVPMLLAVAQSGDPVLQAYRDNILLRQTVTRYANAWHHVKPFWYYLTSVIPPFWLPLSLLLPWLVVAWRKAIQGQDRRIILLLGYLVLVIVFFSVSPGKRGVYVTPGTPALALLTAPFIADLLARRWPGSLLSGLGAGLFGVDFQGKQRGAVEHLCVAQNGDFFCRQPLPQAELFQHVLGGVGEGDLAAVEFRFAQAAFALTLDQGDGQAVAGERAGQAQAGRTGTDDGDIEIHGAALRTDKCRESRQGAGGKPCAGSWKCVRRCGGSSQRFSVSMPECLNA